MQRRDAFRFRPTALPAWHPRSPPRREASSTAIIQSGRQLPGAVTFCPSHVDAPLDIGEGAVPFGVDGGREHHVGVVGAGASKRRRRRRRSGCPRGRAQPVPCPGSPKSGPHPAGKGRRGPARGLGQHAERVEALLDGEAVPHWRSYQSRPSSRHVRPGSRPGDSPRSIAPWTFERRRAGKNATPGRPASIKAASAGPPAASARDGLPMTTATAGLRWPKGRPRRWQSGRARFPRRAARPPGPSPARHTTARATRSPSSPGRYRRDCVAKGETPVGTGLSSMMGMPFSRAACRSRR